MCANVSRILWITEINRDDISIERSFFFLIQHPSFVGFPHLPLSLTLFVCTTLANERGRYAFTEVLSGEEMYKHGLRAYLRHPTEIVLACTAFEWALCVCRCELTARLTYKYKWDVSFLLHVLSVRWVHGSLHRADSNFPVFFCSLSPFRTTFFYFIYPLGGRH